MGNLTSNIEETVVFDNSNIITDISDNIKRQQFENNLTILELIDSFGTHCMFGSAEHKEYNQDQLDRKYLINCISKLSIPKEVCEWIETNMPNKLIRKLQIPSIILIDKDIDKSFTNNEKYCIPYIVEILQYFKDTVVPKLTEKTKHNLLAMLPIKFIPEEDYVKIVNFDEVDETVLDRVIGKTLQMTKLEKQNYIKNCSELNSLNLSKLKTYAYNNFDVLLDYLNIDNLIKQQVELSMLEIWFSLVDTKLHTGYAEIKKSHLIKYYTENDFPDKEYNYYLNFEDHWNMYVMSPTEYVKIITHNYCIDDWTFNSYTHDDYSFLDCFNENVKANIISKINADNNKVMENRYGKIYSLEDLVDINIFINNPPKFLELNGTKYYDDYIEILINTLTKFGYDMNKLKYKKYKLVKKLVYEE